MRSKGRNVLDKAFLLTPVVLLVQLVIGINLCMAVEISGKKNDKTIKIETDMYEVHWKTAQQMGYIIAYVKKKKEKLLLFEEIAGRRLYHSANYAGWKDWGPLKDFKVLENKAGMARIEFISDDGASKEYVCVATFWDGSPLIKHKVTVKAKANVVSFSDGHEPMYEVRSPIKGRLKWDSEGDKGPYAHTAFWTKSGGFSALYATDSQVVAREFPAWQADGRMDLDHKNLGKQVKKGQVSDPIVYWVAFGVGGKNEAHDLAKTVAEVRVGDLAPQAVEATSKLSTRWGEIKASTR